MCACEVRGHTGQLHLVVRHVFSMVFSREAVETARSAEVGESRGHILKVVYLHESWMNHAMIGSHVYEYCIGDSARRVIPPSRAGGDRPAAPAQRPPRLRRAATLYLK